MINKLLVIKTVCLSRRILPYCRSCSLFEILILIIYENIFTDGIQKKKNNANYWGEKNRWHRKNNTNHAEDQLVFLVVRIRVRALYKRVEDLCYYDLSVLAVCQQAPPQKQRSIYDLLVVLSKNCPVSPCPEQKRLKYDQ